MVVGEGSFAEPVQGPALESAFVFDHALSTSHVAIEEAVVKKYLVFLLG